MPEVDGGLWLPCMESDACGIGFVASTRGERSHRIVRKGIESVCRLTHRGAVAADAKTGDGAGILTQIPVELLRAGLGKGQGRLLRRDEDLAVAMMFFPQEAEARHRAYRICEDVVAQSDLIFLEWRLVPTDAGALGDKSREKCPEVRQLLLARMGELSDQEFERVCYRMRKAMERRVAEAGIEGFYIPSFSSRTIVYKGLLVATQLTRFYQDLEDERFLSSMSLYHQRYSTNTYPTWFLAQPFRFLAHNGEINTLQGNVNWMRANELSEDSSIWGSHEALEQLRPIIQPGHSDSSALDNALESVVLGGRDILHAVLMMQPQAYHADSEMSDEVRAFYEYHSCLQEPWDGPAALSFTDGRYIGVSLDRNGLRPVRYQTTDDGLLIVGSEVGTVDLEGACVLEKGRLGPGQILALDTQTGELMRNDDIKERYAARQPYRQWLNENLVHVDKIEAPLADPLNSYHNDGVAHETNGNGNGSGDPLLSQLKAFGWTVEDVEDILQPMAQTGVEATGSMGDDTPLSVLSEKPRLLYNYFRQRFAQVTNPPIDPLREKLVMSLQTFVGPKYNLWEETPQSCRRIEFSSPVLTNDQLAFLKNAESTLGADFKAITIASTFSVTDGEAGLKRAVQTLQAQAESAVKNGVSIVVLSDRGVDENNVPIPALLAVGAVHHHLTRAGLRTKVSIVVESGEPRDSHSLACLFGYGASVVNPYLAYEAISSMVERGQIEGVDGDATKAHAKFRKAVESGLLKVMSKMGISTLSSYSGAQIFEALGLSPELVEECFTHTPSRIRGAGFEEVARDTLRLHETAWPKAEANGAQKLENFAFLRFRKDGEQHAFTPSWFKPFHTAVRNNDYETQYRIFSDAVNTREKPIALRDLLEWRPLGPAIPIDEVEPAEAIYPRLATGAMSHGALSSEAHECLAIAMNRLGGRSNSGEGGEDPRRFYRDENGDWRNSQIKQVASARFGVTPEYLASAKELQIKMAQGAKPGEGGQLPGFKVSEEIGFIRHSVPGVTLISPPPHHDIYSIEDLAQLIYDLKQVNPRARVSVKLVAQAGVGTVAAGVAKAHADTIVISGHDGGTGASPVASIKNTGVSWELGLAEAQQVLIQNNLRGRVVLHADGGFKTGRDVIIAALLGAEEYGFGTQALMAAGCVMARQCHLNTCPVGVAAQREDLRAKFPGKPEHVVNFFTFVVQEIREYMAAMGVRHLDQIIGHSELLRIRDEANYPKTKDVDLSPLFYQFDRNDNNPHRCVVGKNDLPADWPLDDKILQDGRDAICYGRNLTLKYKIQNINRSVGARLAGEIGYRYGDTGLPKSTLTLQFKGSAGQAFGAFCINGLCLELTGEANDYVGKTMHGGVITVRPHDGEKFAWHENVIIGNTVMYGATGGHLFAAGRAGERFCVRNSGGTAVVEGIGDHGCEYMTGGTVVVLGETGRNFGAGMSGGSAYIYDAAGNFEKRFNPDMVGIERVTNDEDVATLRSLIERHVQETTSPHAQALLDDWQNALGQFYKVVPHPEKAPAPKEKEKPARADRPARTPRATQLPPGDRNFDQAIGIKAAEEDATLPPGENQPVEIPAS
jgi:glutamate synthase (NADPH/NADH) large chain/glutamate synthase (ferredoxin)